MEKLFSHLFPPILLLTELILLKASTRTNISRQAELFREITRKFYLYCFLNGSQKEILIFRSLVVVNFTGFLRKKKCFLWSFDTYVSFIVFYYKISS